MRILVTGAAGFIGYHLSKRLLERGDEVWGVDNLNDYYEVGLKLARLGELGVAGEEALSGRLVRGAGPSVFRFRRLSLEAEGALASLFGETGFDRVVNLAAQAGVRYSLENPEAYIQSNVVGFGRLLECCRRAATPHLVYASSSSVYGMGAERPYSTRGPVDHPISLYAATKRADELFAHTYSHLFGLPTTGLRFFTVYGPWGRPDMAYFKFARAILEGRPIEVYNRGDMYRDFTYIDDVVEGLLRILDSRPGPDPAWGDRPADPSTSSAPFRIYNLGNNRPEKLSRFIEILETELGREAEKRYLPLQPGDVLSTEAEVEDLERDFGWKPSTRLEEGLGRFVAWFRDYEAGRKAVAAETGGGA